MFAMNRRKLALMLFVLLLAMTVLAGRGYARYSAMKFGQQLASAFTLINREGFSDTAALRRWFADPDMAGYAKRTSQLAFLGGGYAGRLDELKAGMIYYSEQMSLAEADRFASPPKLKYLAIESGERSDAGVGAAAGRLIMNYAAQL
jgi:hypothetical protein